MRTSLKNYAILKGELLKEWRDGAEFEHFTKKAYYYIKNNLNNNIIYEAGEKFDPCRSLYWASDEELENLFGLPYTSNGAFAAIWNTNTQARAKWGKSLYFRGAAVSTNNKVILLFEDEKENYFYFTEYEFHNYQENEKCKQAARDAEAFNDATEKVYNLAIDILHQYLNKPLGEKTRDKINEQIKAGTPDWVCAYVTFGGNLEVSSRKNHSLYNKTFRLQFLTNENKIREPQGFYTFEHFNGEKEFNKAQKLSEQMKKKAAELLELVEACRSSACKIKQTPKAIESIYTLNLDEVARGCF